MKVFVSIMIFGLLCVVAAAFIGKLSRKCGPAPSEWIKARERQRKKQMKLLASAAKNK